MDGGRSRTFREDVRRNLYQYRMHSDQNADTPGESGGHAPRTSVRPEKRVLPPGRRGQGRGRFVVARPELPQPGRPSGDRGLYRRRLVRLPGRGFGGGRGRQAGAESEIHLYRYRGRDRPAADRRAVCEPFPPYERVDHGAEGVAAPAGDRGRRVHRARIRLHVRLFRLGSDGVRRGACADAEGRPGCRRQRPGDS